MAAKKIARDSLRAAVVEMCIAENAYYQALRLGRAEEEIAQLREKRAELESAAAALVPSNVRRYKTHTCGHEIYQFDNPKLAALAGLDPCASCSNRTVYDNLLRRYIVVHRYRIIGTQHIEHDAYTAIDSSFASDDNGGRYGSITHLGHQLYGNLDSYFPETLFAVLLPSSEERSRYVRRYQGLRAAHARSLIRQAWPEDFEKA